MFVVWRGFGLYTLGFYVLTLIASNPEILLFRTSESRDLNWWLSAFAAAIFNLWLLRVIRRHQDDYTSTTYIGRHFNYLGRVHHIFWIPLQYWTAIFLAIGIYTLYTAIRA